MRSRIPHSQPGLHSPSRRNRGSVLLLTIGVLASLIAIVAVTASSMQVNLRGISNRTSARRARLMAEAGIQEALVTLSTQSTTATTQQDPWYLLGQTGDTRYLVGDDSFRIEIVDAASLVNLNTATETQLDRLPLTQEQIDSLLDWRTAGETARTDGGKDDYYNGLTTPYNAKLTTLNTLDELLLVKGFTPKAIYQPQTNTFSTDPLPSKPDGTQYTLYDLSTVDSGTAAAGGGAGGGTLPNIRTATVANLTRRGIPQNLATQIFQRRNTFTTYNALLGVPGMTVNAAKSLIGAYSVGSTSTVGKIDANTATEAVLDTIPGITSDIGSAIVSYQGTGFTALGDLFNVSGFTLAAARQSLDSFTTRSTTFLVHSLGTAGTTKLSLDAVISFSSTGVKILKITQPPYADMSKQWGWDDQTTTDNQLLQGNTP